MIIKMLKIVFSPPCARFWSSVVGNLLDSRRIRTAQIGQTQLSDIYCAKIKIITLDYIVSTLQHVKIGPKIYGMLTFW